MVEIKYVGEELWDKDRVHIRDMISIGLIDESWLPGYSLELQSRLKELLDDPEG